MALKLGTGTYTWATQDVSLVDSLREMADLGIRYVDVLGAMHGDPTELSEEDQRAVKTALDDLGLIPSSLLAVKRDTINVAAAEDEQRRRTWHYFNAILDFASTLGTRQICLMAGDKIMDVPNDEAWGNAATFCKRLAQLGRERDLLLTFELEWRTCGIVQTIGQMEQMIADIDEPNVLANMDIGHVALARDGHDDLRRIAPKTIHLHLNDNDTVLHTNALPGDGDVPIVELVRTLLDAGAPAATEACGETLVAGIEIEDAGGTGDAASELIRRSKDWIVEHLPEIEV